VEEFIVILTEYGPYVGLAVVVAGVVQAFKQGFKKFFTKHHVGMRILPFIPILLGMVGGLLLPPESFADKLLIGGALGTCSSLIYKALTRTFASKAKLMAKAGSREG